MRLLLMLIAAALLAACQSSRSCFTRTEIRTVPQPVWIDLPEEYTQPLPVPALEGPLPNRDLEAAIESLEAVIDQAQDDRAEIRRLQRQRKDR